jgi:hypothetical protein
MTHKSINAPSRFSILIHLLTQLFFTFYN